MHLRKLISRSFFHYFRANISAAAGIAIATAVITGALITGDSLSYSLKKAVTMRLGQVTHSITAGERLFTAGLASRFEKESGMTVSAGLVAEGMALSTGGRERLNRVQVIGIDSKFGQLLGSGLNFETGPGQVIISRNMADRLQLEAGDFFQLRMKRAGVIPANTPLVSDAGSSVSRRVMVASIAEDADYGRFSLRISQTAPYNVFADIGWLNMVMELDGHANIIFISANENTTGDLRSFLEKSWDVEDANLTLSEVPNTGKTRITSERVFIGEQITPLLDNLFPGNSRHLTYFVNSLESASGSTPYSFVSAGSPWPLKPGQTLINRWLADDLNARAGDTLTMRYWETGPRRELTERHVSLVVAGIREMGEAAADSILMPHLPGLSDAGNCRDWDAGVPVEFSRIRDRDEAYWNDYRGTPKAWISLEQGQQLWTNRFGDLTCLWTGNGQAYGIDAVRGLIRDAIDPALLGFRINNLKEEGLTAASRGVNFGMLFGGLGAFVMMSGIMLFLLLMLFNMESRSGQIRLFSSLGYRAGTIRKIYIGEGMLTTLAGSAAGLLLAVVYSNLVRHALGSLWQDIVRTDLLELVIRPSSLLAGFATGAGIALIVIVFSIEKYVVRKVSNNGRAKTGRRSEGGTERAGGVGTPVNASQGVRRRLIFSAILATIAASVLLLSLTRGIDAGPAVFFLTGGLLVPAFLLAADALLLWLQGKNYRDMTLAGLSLKNMTRNRTRSLSVIIILALGIFVVTATGTHRKDATTGWSDPEGGTGGFLFVAETTVPVLSNLNSSETRIDLNIPGEVSFVQFMAGYADDASCLNLNEVANPRILATDPALLEGRFSFARNTPVPDAGSPWSSLNINIAPERSGASHIIPAIADQAVIQWGLGKRAGDTLTYTNERGEELKLVLVGGLDNSVFQGNVIISEENFLNHFPSSGGSSFFLVDARHDRMEELQEDLNFIFRDHGWEMATAAHRLNEFNSVENTYLGIFLMLGALGILLGVIGLAVVMARSIIERRSEIALYSSLGFRRSGIASVISGEYMILLLAGFAAGIPPALIAATPSLISGSRESGLLFAAVMMGIILLNGMLWIFFTSRIMIKKKGLVTALRND
jgi:putative ABC transport system permease protein